MFLLLCFVSCVVGRTCGPIPLLAMYAINMFILTFLFLVLLGGAKSHIQAEIQNMKDKSQTHETQNPKHTT